MNLVKVLYDRLPTNLQAFVKVQYRMRQDIEVPDQVMTRIAGLLHHNPEAWLYLHKRHPLRARAEAGIREVIDYLPEHSVILAHPHEKWCVVAFDDIVYPAIFKSDIRATYLHKIVAGKASRWLVGMRKDIAHILAHSEFIDGDTSPKLANFKDDPVARLSGAGFKWQ
jgi:hypothetical protein